MRRQRSGKGGCSMKNYDFHHLLEPVEFQEFARDMIQVREKIRLEAFREGPDQGMDA